MTSKQSLAETIFEFCFPIEPQDPKYLKVPPHKITQQLSILIDTDKARSKVEVNTQREFDSAFEIYPMDSASTKPVGGKVGAEFC